MTVLNFTPEFVMDEDVFPKFRQGFEYGHTEVRRHESDGRDGVSEVMKTIDYLDAVLPASRTVDAYISGILEAHNQAKQGVLL